MEDKFPAYQWSTFIDSNRNEQYVVRDNDYKEFLLKVAAIKDLTKTAQPSTPDIEYVNGRVCPKDKGKLVISKTKTGKTFYKCENAKWDAEAHKSIGCDYVDWLNPAVKWDKTNPYKGKTMTVEEYENLPPSSQVEL
jgi:ssDNA-binding Zn-finger/Zn-ribbon topoisomerase 1